MTTTFPSKKVTVADIKDTEELIGKFVYNFFCVDEDINDSGLTVTSEDLVNLKVPRYIKLEWPAIDNNSLQISLENNVDKINFEDKNFNFGPFSKMHFNFTEKNNQLNNLIYRAFYTIAGDDLGISFSENARNLNELTNQNILPETIQNAIMDLNGVGLYFGDTKKEPEATTSLNLILNDKNIFDLASHNIIENVLSPPNTKEKIDNLLNNQRNSITEHDSNLISLSEYKFTVSNQLSFTPTEIRISETEIQYVGYIIEKEEIMNDSFITKETNYVNGSNKNNFIDTKIKYGTKYRYKIRSVAKISTFGRISNTDGVGKIEFLLASNPIFSNDIETKEYISPPTIADFQLRWDYNISKLILTWALPPTNSQRDIKYFQIFRRENIKKAFELIQLYNFNDSLNPITISEMPSDPLLIKTSNDPICFFIDSEFTKESKFIYAICTIDAHGFSSNYSIQFEVFFNKTKNKLEKKLISISGAPKIYPNAFLNTDTFVDTIKNEGHSNVEIVFSPEYLKITNRNNNDLKILKTERNDTYQLQLINLDLQSQETITINLTDRTTNGISNT